MGVLMVPSRLRFLAIPGLIERAKRGAHDRTEWKERDDADVHDPDARSPDGGERAGLF